MQINLIDIFVFIPAILLALIPIRRIINGQLPIFGLKVFMTAGKIDLDAFDKLMITIAGISIITFITLLVFQS